MKGQLFSYIKSKKGLTDKSYGIHVARLAELPDAIIDRAQTILTELESGSHEVIPRVSKAPKKWLRKNSDFLSLKWKKNRKQNLC